MSSAQLGCALGRGSRDELGGLGGGQRRERQLASIGIGSASGWPSSRRVSDEQHARRARAVQDFGEQREAVGVGPLDVVDRDEQRLPLGERVEQVPRGRGTRAHAARAGSAGSGAASRAIAGTRNSTGNVCASADSSGAGGQLELARRRRLRACARARRRCRRGL